MKIELGSGVMLLTITLVLLKAFDKLDWSWWWVFAPLWLPTLFILVCILILVILLALAELMKAVW